MNASTATGIDQLYETAADFLFPDWAPWHTTDPDIKTIGQRSWGGDGIDFFYAFTGIGRQSPAQLANEYNLLGDDPRRSEMTGSTETCGVTALRRFGQQAIHGETCRTHSGEHIFKHDRR
jgi:hypothetical protein